MTGITTFSGLNFNYLNPTLQSICIEDITQSLSHECCFAGHLAAFYSVAQHSLLLSQLVPPEYALEALLYNASAAYCRDIPSPLKQLLPNYQIVESLVDTVIRKKFALPSEKSDVVHFYHLIMLATEIKELDIRDGRTRPMLTGIPVKNMAISPMLPAQVRSVFLTRFNELAEGAAVCP